VVVNQDVSSHFLRLIEKLIELIFGFNFSFIGFTKVPNCFNNSFENIGFNCWDMIFRHDV
jgi:hypothetical protein